MVTERCTHICVGPSQSSVTSGGEGAGIRGERYERMSIDVGPMLGVVLFNA